MPADSQYADSAGTTTMPRPPHTGAARGRPTQPERACCCSARPMMIAMIPSGAGRPAPVDLWLCGHHYRKSQQALKAAGAEIATAPGATGQ